MSKQVRLCLAIVAFGSLFSCAKVVVVRVDTNDNAKDKIKAEGVFYALPKTVLRTQISVDRDQSKRGDYAEFAKVFAPDQDPVCVTDCAEKNKTPFSVEPGATITTFGEPDPANVYMVKFAGRGAVDQNLALTWTETGVISTASASVTNRTTDVIVSGLKLAAGVASKTALGAGSAAAPPTSCHDTPSATQQSVNDEWVLGLLNKLDQRPRGVLVNNYCVIDQNVRDSQFASPSQRDQFSKALAVYMNQIWPLVQARGDLLLPTVGLTEPTELLTRLESQIDPLLKKYFLGSKTTTVWAGTVDIRVRDEGPGIPGGAGLAVLRVDAAKGVCLVASDAQLSPDGKPVPDGFLATDCPAESAVLLGTSLWPARQMFQFVENGTTELPEPLSFRYRIPAQIRAELTQGKKSLGAAVVSVAQFGRVRALPATRHSKTLSYDLAMVEATGGLKSFKIGTTGSVDAGTVDALSGVAGTLLDARNASIKADQTAQDPATKLGKQDGLLKLQDDICTIQKKYGLTCTNPPQ